MTLLVPFDGSDLATAALERAVEFGEFSGDEVVVLSVVPDDDDYAREVGWIDEGEEFVPELVAGDLERRARRVAPEATVRTRVIDTGDAGASASVPTDVVRSIREVAGEVDASIVFVGSENAGRVATPVSSVGKPLSEDPHYDVHIVRHAG